MVALKALRTVLAMSAENQQQTVTRPAWARYSNAIEGWPISQLFHQGAAIT
jgi:hypothetical protein